MSLWQRLRIDNFLLILISVVILATFFPCQGGGQTFFNLLAKIAIVLLFFMHGAKLSRSAIIAGIGHWRLHLLVLCSTFVLFPLLGLAMRFNIALLMPDDIYLGFIYLCILPATVQSAIAYTSMAKGNVAAAVCSASASSILGVFLSPLLVALLLHVQGGQNNTLHAVGAIFSQLTVPFILGHLARPWLADWMSKYKRWIAITDRSSILLVVYTAFSEAVVAGIWQQVTGLTMLTIIAVSLLLLGVVLVINTWLARWLGFNRADEATIVFCGSKKSLVNGIPMANVLFPITSVGIIVLPLMIFHQLQLMVCAFLAQRYARKANQESMGD